MRTVQPDQPFHVFIFSYTRSWVISYIPTTATVIRFPLSPGEPERVCIPDSVDEFAELLWDALDSENKISLFVRYTDLESGREEDTYHKQEQIRRRIMKEFELKYGCNPNQKPARIYMRGRQRPARLKYFPADPDT